MEAKVHEITLGETVCDRLKIIYFDKRPWPECYKDVARKFSELKVIMRKFYVDKTEIEMLRELTRFTYQDLKDAFEDSGSKSVNQTV